MGLFNVGKLLRCSVKLPLNVYYSASIVYDDGSICAQEKKKILNANELMAFNFSLLRRFE